MAIPVKDAATLAKKFAARAAAAGPEYLSGVTGAGARWQTNATAGAQAWQDGVSEAAGRGAFQKGVAASGGAHFEERATTIGARRFPEGVRAAESTWAEGAQPFLQEIAAATLSPRGAKGDPRNYDRSRELGEKLRAKKLAMQR